MHHTAKWIQTTLHTQLLLNSSHDIQDAPTHLVTSYCIKAPVSHGFILHLPEKRTIQELIEQTMYHVPPFPIHRTVLYFNSRPHSVAILALLLSIHKQQTLIQTQSENTPWPDVRLQTKRQADVGNLACKWRGQRGALLLTSGPFC